MQESEYYLLYAENIFNSPAIIFDEGMGRINHMITTLITDVDVVKFKFWEPYPKKPIMVDYHDNGVLAAVSQKICDVIAPLKIRGVQLIPATILDPRNGTEYDQYYFLHIYNGIVCLDLENSVYKKSSVGPIRSITKMILNEAILNKIPLEDRLIFRLEELRNFPLFHKSIVDQIININPQGMKFVPVEKYHIGSAFD